MPFWPTNNLTVPNLERLGMWDVVVGTDGQTTDINAAYAAGHRRMLLVQGAILTANLTLSASTGCLFNPSHPQAMNLGAYTLTVSGSNWNLEGFRLLSATGVALVISGGEASLSRLELRSAGSHGLHITTASNNYTYDRVQCYDNGGDGVRVESGATNHRFHNCSFFSNTGYGVNDLDDSTILVGNLITPNTAGAINGTPDLDVGNKKS